MSLGRSVRALVRGSLLVSLRYRGDFFFSAIYSLIIVASMLVPLIVVYGGRRTIVGFSFEEALLVTAWFTFEKALLNGLMTPSMVRAIERIRDGSFDFVLLKPINPQIVASIGKLEVFSAFDAAAAVVLLGIALHRMHHVPTEREAILALLLTLAATAILYSINMLVLSTAFYVARIDNLVHLFSSIFDAARWPSTVFRGLARVLFTFVLPLGVMTTFPALAVLGRLPPRSAAVDLAIAAIAVVGSSHVFRRALRAYTSAGG
jgi:ABC-2 type transport system permease protein